MVSTCWKEVILATIAVMIVRRALCERRKDK